jgi:hypothetical protein
MDHHSSLTSIDNMYYIQYKYSLYNIELILRALRRVEPEPQCTITEIVACEGEVEGTVHVQVS